MARPDIRRAPHRNLAGFLVTLGLHGIVVGAVVAAHHKGDVPLDVPRDFVAAKLVKLGKPRDKFWLPRVSEPPRAKAPPPTLKLSDNPEAEAAPKEAPRPEDPEVSKDLRHALDRARRLANLSVEPDEAPAEGLPTGSAEGTATTASAGDEYATAVMMAVRKNWTTPTGLVSEAALARLSADVRIKVGEDGSIAEAKLTRSSGSAAFDDSCTAAVEATRKLPAPPAGLRRQLARGLTLQFDGKELAQ